MKSGVLSQRGLICVGDRRIARDLERVEITCRARSTIPHPPLENQQTRVIEAIVYASILPRDLTFPVPWKSVVHTSSHNDPEHYPGYCQSEPLGSKYCIKERLNQYEGE